MSKGVKPHGLREYKGALVVPIWKSGKIVGLQFMEPDGEKPFLKGTPKKGAYYVVGEIEHANRVCIAEGFATAATIYEATGIACVVAFDAGNLPPAAEALKLILPGVQFIVAADDDWKRVNQAGELENIGLIKAREAAQAIGAKLAVPDFQGCWRQDKHTDFNDLFAFEGPERVRECIERADFAQPSADSDSADNADSWPELEPFASVARKPYPLDALPDIVREAVEEVQGFNRTPMAMTATSALGVLSACAQHIADVERDETLAGPVSLWTMVLAQSGERKSRMDGLFSAPIKAYQAKMAEALKPEIEARDREISAWKAKREGYLEAIKKQAKEGKPTDKFDELLNAMPAEPKPIMVPMILRGDDTTENLCYALTFEWRSAAVLESEAGTVLGSHAMGADKIMGGLAVKNKLWDGGEHHIGRRTSESFTVRGARFTYALQIQPEVIRQFQEKNGGLARGIGYWARFLICEPESTQGTRLYREPPKDTPKLGSLHERLYKLVIMELVFGEHGGLEPPRLKLSADGKGAWIEAHDAIEVKLLDHGDYATVRDVASKAADNIARLAALFHILGHGPDGEVSAENVRRAAVIVDYHLNEARSFFAGIAAPPEERDAAKLEEWLVAEARERGTNLIPRRDADRGAFGGRGGRGNRLDAAIQMLSDLGRVRLIPGKNNQRHIEIRPSLVGGQP